MHGDNGLPGAGAAAHQRGAVVVAIGDAALVTVEENAPACPVGAERFGMRRPNVVTGNVPDQPRHDLKRPWDAVSKRAGLTGVRLRDLRHTFASFGAGSGLGLPVIGRLLGHSQAATSARYAHLDNDPLRRASEAIANKIAAALERNQKAPVISIARNGVG
jgi:hypothetical protein